jgi:hypothetical protein
MKAAASLFQKADERLQAYDREKLMNILQDSRYHSPEISETDDEARTIHVYNPSWRSPEVFIL